MINRIGERIKKSRNQKGFTLVELMVVVAIIGILSAIAVPVYRNVTEKANRSAVEANLRTIDGAIMMYPERITAELTYRRYRCLDGDYIQACLRDQRGNLFCMAQDSRRSLRGAGKFLKTVGWKELNNALPMTGNNPLSSRYSIR
ncbi:MAG: type IV pilin protein [Syntrophomonadaceae bacterium]